jgi:hypothetical protein
VTTIGQNFVVLSFLPSLYTRCSPFFLHIKLALRIAIRSLPMLVFEAVPQEKFIENGLSVKADHPFANPSVAGKKRKPKESVSIPIGEELPDIK